MASVLPILLAGWCCAVVWANRPEGYILHVNHFCNSLDEYGAEISILTDLRVDAYAECDDSIQHFVTTDHVHYLLTVGYPGHGSHACLFKKKGDGLDVYVVRVVVSIRDMDDYQLDQDEEFNITCTFDSRKAENAGNIAENTGNNVPDAGKNVPDAGKNVPDAGNNVPDAGNNAENAGYNVPTSSNNVPNTGNDVENTGIDVENMGIDVEGTGENKESTETIDVEGLIGPVEMETEILEPDTGSTITLHVVDAMEDDMLDSRVAVGRRIKLKAIASGSASNEQGLRPLTCDAIGGGERYPIIEDGCGDGIVFSRKDGFLTEGLVSTSPYFDAFRFNDRDAVHFECNFMFCSNACDGNSCDLSARRRRSDKSSDKVFITAQARIEVAEPTSPPPPPETNDKDTFVKKTKQDEPAMPILSDPYFVIPIAILGVLAVVSFLIASCACARRANAQVYVVNKKKMAEGHDTPVTVPSREGKATTVPKDRNYAPVYVKACGCPSRNSEQHSCVPDCRKTTCDTMHLCDNFDQNLLNPKLCDGDCLKPCNTRSGSGCSTNCTNECNSDALYSNLCDGDCVTPCNTESGGQCDVACSNVCNKDLLDGKMCDADCVEPCNTESGARCDSNCTNTCNK